MKLYFKYSISITFYFTMEGPTISNNILRLSADMENLRGLGHKPPWFAIQKTLGLNILSALYSTRYRAALVCPVRYPLQSCSCLYLVRYPLQSCSCLACKWMVKTLIVSRFCLFSGWFVNICFKYNNNNNNYYYYYYHLLL